MHKALSAHSISIALFRNPSDLLGSRVTNTTPRVLVCVCMCVVYIGEFHSLGKSAVCLYGKRSEVPCCMDSALTRTNAKIVETQQQHHQQRRRRQQKPLKSCCRSRAAHTHFTFMAVVILARVCVCFLRLSAYWVKLTICQKKRPVIPDAINVNNVHSDRSNCIHRAHAACIGELSASSDHDFSWGFFWLLLLLFHAHMCGPTRMHMLTLAVGVCGAVCEQRAHTATPIRALVTACRVMKILSMHS